MLRNGTRGVPEISGGGGGGGFSNTYSLALDGVDDKVQFSSISLGADYTLSAWAKRTSTANMFLFGNAQTYGYGAYFNGTSALYYKETTLVTFNNVAIQTALARTDWVNWVFKKDSGAGTMAVYVDGVLAQSVTTGNGMSTITTIGASGLSTGTQYVWSGNIDEVSIFNTSAIDLADLGSTTTPKDLSAISGLTNWYRNGDNGTWQQPQWLIPSNENKDKVSNYSFDFDGIDDKVDCGTLPHFTTSQTTFSVSFWFKNLTSNGHAVNIGNKIYFVMGSNRIECWNLGNVNGRTDTTGIIFGTTWHNLTYIFDGSGATNEDRVKVWIDGVLNPVIYQNTQPTSTTATSVSTLIGSSIFGAYYNGNVDEVSIFDSVISIGDVWDGSGEPTTISGAIAHYKMGEEATFSTNWTVPDQVGSNDGTSANMLIDARIGDSPNSTSNALSFNMDEVDRETDVPT